MRFPDFRKTYAPVANFGNDRAMGRSKMSATHYFYLMLSFGAMFTWARLRDTLPVPWQLGKYRFPSLGMSQS